MTIDHKKDTCISVIYSVYFPVLVQQGSPSTPLLTSSFSFKGFLLAVHLFTYARSSALFTIKSISRWVVISKQCSFEACKLVGMRMRLYRIEYIPLWSIFHFDAQYLSCHHHIVRQGTQSTPKSEAAESNFRQKWAKILPGSRKIQNWARILR